MTHLRDYVWLLVGTAAAIVVPFAGGGAWLERLLGSVVPLPWARIGLALLIFGTAAALHFRFQLVRGLEQGASQRERQRAASRLINAAVADGRRWLLVIQENLELVGDEDLPQRSRLYLEGARAHADKLEQAFERIEGNQRGLEGQEH
jgi:hypothetical protein